MLSIYLRTVQMTWHVNSVRTNFQQRKTSNNIVEIYFEKNTDKHLIVILKMEMANDKHQFRWNTHRCEQKIEIANGYLLKFRSILGFH